MLARVKTLLDEFVTYVCVGCFAAGWIDFGQGADLTWWALIRSVAQ
jgi:hypothetical protein